ncbi:MAG: hypothetical protein IJZ29_02065 [Clostridia bacterium]|nr:hypothetical protein [Clostridia bacterium]
MRFILRNYKHLICIVVTLAFIACSLLIFSDAFIRMGEVFTDLWTSTKYFFYELFAPTNKVTATVTQYSNINYPTLFGLPETWAEFKTLFNDFTTLLLETNNYYAYIDYIGDLFYVLLRYVILILVPLLLLLYLMFKLLTLKSNNNYNQDSKALKLYKVIEDKLFLPIKNWLNSFVYFIKEHSYYLLFWALIWAFNFHLIQIIVEFFAFYLYLVVSYDIGNLYVQFVKFVKDLSIFLNFTPPLLLVLLLFWAFYACCKVTGYARLERFEKRNCGFINERPIVALIVGSMGKKKTTKLVDMALSQEAMFRTVALEKMQENDLKFPHFPWVNLENWLKWAIKNHLIYNLASCRLFISRLCLLYYVGSQDKACKKSIRKYLQKQYNLPYSNLLFDYDFEKYGLLYNDKLKVVDIWQVIETYSQLYFIYTVKSSLLIANCSVRTDNIMEDDGNLPLWDIDFFNRNSKELNKVSNYAHIIDFDALRLGKKVIEDNKLKDSFDFGIVVITEIGKERKNTLELKEVKKNEEITNQKNDGFNDWLKMVRHSATVDNFPFVKVITDDQRPESWGADARDLTEIVHILVYLLKKIVSVLHNYSTRLSNVFGYFQLNVAVEAGIQDGVLNDKKYYLMTKKIYSNRFSTDCFSDFFSQKTLRSSVGIDDLPTYNNVKATMDELKQQNSYFIADLTARMNNDNEKKQ